MSNQRYTFKMRTLLKKFLYLVFKHPVMKPTTDSSLTSSNTVERSYKRPFVMLRAHIGPIGNVLEVTIKLSSGNPIFDQMAIDEVKATPFASPKKGHKMAACWRNLRWDLPQHLR